MSGSNHGCIRADRLDAFPFSEGLSEEWGYDVCSVAGDVAEVVEDAAKELEAGRSLTSLLTLAKTYDMSGFNPVDSVAAAIGAQACMHRLMRAHPFGLMTSCYAIRAYNLALIACRDPSLPGMNALRRDAAVAALATTRHAPHMLPRFRRQMEPEHFLAACEAEQACLPLNAVADSESLRPAVEQRVHVFLGMALSSDPSVREEPSVRELDPGPMPVHLFSAAFCRWLALMEFRDVMSTVHPARQGLIDAYQHLLHGFPKEAECIFRNLYLDQTDKHARFLPPARGCVLATLTRFFQDSSISLEEKNYRHVCTLSNLLDEMDPSPTSDLLHLLWCRARSVMTPSQAFEFIRDGLLIVEVLAHHPNRPAWLKDAHLEDAERELAGE